MLIFSACSLAAAFVTGGLLATSLSDPVKVAMLTVLFYSVLYWGTYLNVVIVRSLFKKYG
jgi:hypothetical protein